MNGFRKWLLQQEMLSPVPFPAISTAQRAGLGLVSAMPTGQAKLPRWKRTLGKPKAVDDGKWR
jgi:hypothetical protein